MLIPCRRRCRLSHVAATADLLFMCQILHPDVSAPKRTNIMNVAAKLLALKTDSLGETFKMKDVCARMIGWLLKKILTRHR